MMTLKSSKHAIGALVAIGFGIVFQLPPEARPGSDATLSGDLASKAVRRPAPYLLVADYDKDCVRRYDALTGAFVDVFVGIHSAKLKDPQFLVFGPHDHDLYVGTGHFGGPLKAVLR